MSDKDVDNKSYNQAPGDVEIQGQDATQIRPTARNTATAMQHSDTVIKNRTSAENDKTQYRSKQSHAAQGNTQTRVKPQPQTTNRQNPVNKPASSPQILKDRFLLEQVIGVGGMGVVYKARDRLKVEAKDRDPYVAIKVLNEEFRTHPEAFITLQRESRKSQRISHPNTVKVYDFDRDGEIVFMTMEYMQGKPLDELIRQYSATGLPPEDCWQIIEGMCQALIHAHAESIVHSDFKPGNVFVTDSGMAKIFDFGIARAVAQVDRHDGKHIDKTVFDAGTLGALTPAYASLEMLKGMKPDVRDDIYALGCVIYEIFTGKHPFARLPADEAQVKGLKPEKISSISKRQWKALEKALSFERNDRTETVEDLYEQLTGKFKPGFKLYAAVTGVVFVVMLSLIILGNNKQPEFNADDLRDEIALKVRYDVYKQTLEKLISDPTFSVEWEESVWEQVQGIQQLIKSGSDIWLDDARTQLYTLYLEKVREYIGAKKLKKAEILIANAPRYAGDISLLDAESENLAQAMKNTATQPANIPSSETVKKAEIDRDEKGKLDVFNLAMANVNQQLECTSRMNMRDFSIAIDKLRTVDPAKFSRSQESIVTRLAQCIATIGKRSPESGLDSKKSALRIFDNHPKIAAINIRPRDACDVSMAGLGARGKRTICRDKIPGRGYGPSMVVIPANSTNKLFAIGKYEVTIAEFNDFCESTSQCKPLNSTNGAMPVTNIPIDTVSKYLRWLTTVTNQKYRLPTYDEWKYASLGKQKKLDPNRNCSINSRGIQKGGGLVEASTGGQNDWGLVNAVGNAQELVYGKGRQLAASGGSYTDSMSICQVSYLVEHDGTPDNKTGFRVLREIKDN